MTSALASPPTPLTRAQLRHYEDEGYLILRGLLPAVDIAAAAAEAESLLLRRDLIFSDNLRCRWQPHVETSECLFETFDPVIDIGPVCARLAGDQRILDALACLYDGPACLFKDKLIFKPPGARGYDLHQDYISWPDFPRSFVTVLIGIDPAGPDNGCTEVFPGCHRAGYLSPEDGDYHPIPPGTIDESNRVFLDLQPGDVAVFGCLMPHRSGPNRSERWRRQLYLSYNARADGGERRDRHYREFHEWLKGKYAEYGKLNVYFR
jgi:hypothetical protein